MVRREFHWRPRTPRALDGAISSCPPGYTLVRVTNVSGDDNEECTNLMSRATLNGCAFTLHGPLVLLLLLPLLIY